MEALTRVTRNVTKKDTLVPQWHEYIGRNHQLQSSDNYFFKKGGKKNIL